MNEPFILIHMKKPTLTLPSLPLAIGLSLSAPAAHAHHAEAMSHSPFLQGASMPVHGLDHLLSAFAVGLVASQVGSKHRAGLLALYATIGLVSGLLNVSGTPMPDCVVPLTTAVAGLLLWKGLANGWVLGGLTVAAAGFCHGDALLNRTVAGADWALFCSGGLLATLALSGLGLLAGHLAASTRLRFAGAALMACTFLLLLFPEANGVLVRLLEGAQ
jgi:urease accessory protein